MIGFMNSHPLIFIKKYYTELKCMINSVDKYLHSFKNSTARICNIDSNIYHLWHGSAKKRAYVSRWNILKSIDDICDILTVGSNGLFVIKDDPSLKRKIKKYFQNRDDDGI